jgi:hypothetical protein
VEGRRLKKTEPIDSFPISSKRPVFIALQPLNL